MFDDFEAGRLTANGIEISYVAAGEGAPVLLLHGFPQNKALWAKIAPALVNRGFRVICPDLRGYGQSSKPLADPDLANYSFRAMAMDQIALMTSLGHDRFHVVGHDRGARVAHRLCLDHGTSVMSLTMMDIVPTFELLSDLRKEVAQSYWHWFFLAQPAPFPEQVIQANPDLFYEACLFGWGGAKAEDFAPLQLAAYRASWHDPDSIAGGCNDYRAALKVDFANDKADRSRLVETPAMVLYGASGTMARLYDIPSVWASYCASLEAYGVPGGHFFPDIEPGLVVDHLARFLRRHLIDTKSAD